MLARWPGGLVEFYGMTEGGGTCILAAHEHPDKLHTVGQPAEGHDIRLIDEAGRELPRGATGEVVGHSARHDDRLPRPAGEDRARPSGSTPSGKRFIRTGDVGRFDDDGFLTLVDRKKDMIISGGFNIYPSDLEAVLREHPDGRRGRRRRRAVGALGRDAGGLRRPAPRGAATLDADGAARLGSTRASARPSASPRCDLVDELPRSAHRQGAQARAARPTPGRASGRRGRLALTEPAATAGVAMNRVVLFCRNVVFRARPDRPDIR